MSKTKWTPSQKEAIQAQGGNLLIAAAAGAGKTSVLVERIINRLKDSKHPLDIDRLLVVTFTNAAAAQMREQIGRALTQELSRQPATGHLRRQLALLNYSAITTLHSFCLEVLRQHYYRLELDPNFRVADDGEASLLQLEVLEDLLEAKYQEDGADRATERDVFLNLVDCYGGEKSDAGLGELVLNLYLFSRSHPWPDFWLEQAAANFDFPADYTVDAFVWTPLLKQNLAMDLQEACRKLEQALQNCSKPQAPTAYQANLSNDLAMLQDLVKACGHNWQQLFDAFKGAAFGRLKSVPKKEKEMVDPALQEQIKQLRDEAKSIVYGLRDTYFLSDPDQQLQDLRQVAPLLKALVGLVGEFAARFQKAKQRRGLVDFSDLEHCCLRILMDQTSQPGCQIPSAVAKGLRERFIEVLVDEYQDINPVQEAILQLVSRQNREGVPLKGDDGQPSAPEQALSLESGLLSEGVLPNLFLVGDVKQSIYRFRLADPGLFLDRYHRFSIAPGARERRINLRENFRSSPSIVDGVNFFFRQIMSVYLGEMVYDAEAELVCGLTRPMEEHPAAGRQARLPAAVELYLIDRRKGVFTADNRNQAVEPQTAGSLAADQLTPAEDPAPAIGFDFDSDSAFDADSDSDSAPAAGSEPSFIEEVLDVAELEARAAARQIRQMVVQEQQIWDHKLGQYRPVRYGDIAVLMRTTRGLANVYLTEFRQMGIPAYAELGTGYFAAGEVEIMLALLQIIDNPLQDIPLAAVLRSPIVGLKAEEMAQIRVAGGPGRSYYETLVAAAAALDSAAATANDEASTTGAPDLSTTSAAMRDASNAAATPTAASGASKASAVSAAVVTDMRTGADAILPEPTRRKIQVFLEALPKWRTQARRERLTTLLWQIWQQTGYFDYVGGMPGGAQRQANLRLLQTWAGEYESTAFRGLAHFLRFVERIRETGGDRGAARTLSENEDVVRIMSIHKSKGLEFPVVWVTGLGRQFNLMDLRGPLLTHKDWGFGPQLIDPAESISYPTLAKLALQSRIKLETLAEEIRLLYVAMTRAREKLYLMGSIENLASRAGAWCQIAQTTAPALPEAALARARCYLDWVGPALARHEQGKALWKAAGQDWRPEFGLKDRAVFKLWIISPKEIEQPAETPLSDQAEFWEKVRAGKSLKPGEMAAEIERRLHWQYPFAAVAGKAAKLTVSEIKRLFEPLSLPAEELEAGEGSGLPETVPALRDAFEIRLQELKKPVFRNQPRFIQEQQGLTPAERGSAVHLVMQNLNLKGPLDHKGIMTQINGFVAKEMLTAEQAEAVDPAAVAGFLASPLGQRMLKASRVYRELPFSMTVPANRVYADLPEEGPEQAPGQAPGPGHGTAPVMVQGVIDCLIEEEDGFVLLDYKTDWPGGPARIQELTERYQWQLWFYAQAAELIFKQPVKELFLYLLAGGIAQPIPRDSLKKI